MEYVLLHLKVPSNVEKAVRALKTALYRECGLVSARALPVLLPLRFLPPDGLPEREFHLREAIRRAVGKKALRLQCGPIGEHRGHLYWTLDPQADLEQLGHGQHDRSAPELFPVAPGFLLSSLEGRELSRLSLPSVPENLADLSFPAKAAALLRIRILEGEPVSETPPPRCDSWWKALYWETLAEVPLRKTAPSN